MTELKCLLQSVPFRTFAMSPLANEAMCFQQCPSYEPKYNPLKHQVPPPSPAAPIPETPTPTPTPTHGPKAAPPTPKTIVAARNAPKTYEYDHLTELLIRHLDDLSPMYSREWMRDATQQIKQKLVAFLVEPNVVKALGRKKTCDAIYFLELRPKPDDARMKNLGWILSFLLDRIVYINEKKHTWNSKAGPSVKFEITHHANGRWSVKN